MRVELPKEHSSAKRKHHNTEQRRSASAKRSFHSESPNIKIVHQGSLAFLNQRTWSQKRRYTIVPIKEEAHF